MSDAIVVFNAGSTSLKFAAYAVIGPTGLTLMRRGEVEGMDTNPRFVGKDAAGQSLDAHKWGEGR